MKVTHKATEILVAESGVVPTEVALNVFQQGHTTPMYTRLTPTEARRLAKKLNKAANAISPKVKDRKTLIDGDGDTWYREPGLALYTLSATGAGWATKQYVVGNYGTRAGGK